MKRTLLALVALTFLGAVQAEAQQRQIRGRVVTANQQPLTAAVVSVAPATSGALTNESGNFVISAPSGEVTLEASSPSTNPVIMFCSRLRTW